MVEHKYDFIKLTNPDQLKLELDANKSLIIGVHAVTITDSTITNVYMKDDLNEHLGQFAVLEAAVNAHVKADTPKITHTPMMTIVENERAIAEGSDLTYRMLPWLFDIPEGSNNGEPYVFNVSFPHAVVMLGATVDLHPAMVGDSMAYDIPSDITIGFLVQNTVIGENTGVLNEGAASNFKRGMDVVIGGVTRGRIFEKNGSAFKIQTPWQSVLTAGTPVAIRYRMVDRYLVTAAPIILWVSRDTFRGAVISENMPQRFSYWNTTGTAKKVQIAIEFYT